MARENGVRAEITDVVVIGENLVVGLKILADKERKPRSKNVARWQVLSVEDGRITEIRGYETRGDATAYARSGVLNWKS
jgi:hypothetical protein